jgi:hypothetical protein
MDIECPYCEAEQEVNHDDGFGYDENTSHQMQCGFCNLNFVFQTSIIFHYNPAKADCLNDADHDFEPTCTYPKEFTKMQCKHCGETRNPTTKEFTEILSKP